MIFMNLLIVGAEIFHSSRSKDDAVGACSAAGGSYRNLTQQFFEKNFNFVKILFNRLRFRLYFSN